MNIPHTPESGGPTPNPRHIPPAAGGATPDPGLAERSCPGCGRKGTLTELVAATSGTGRRPDEVELTSRAGWLGCSACTWSNEDKPTAGRVLVPGTDGTPDAWVSREVVDVLHDVPAHEPGGGGGSGRTRKKPSKRGAWRPDQEPLPAAPDRTTSTTVVETRSEVVHVRVSKGDKTRAQALAHSHHQTVSDLMLWGLHLVDAFRPGAWQDMEHEAQRRGLPNATALLSHGFESWWRAEVREGLG